MKANRWVTALIAATSVQTVTAKSLPALYPGPQLAHEYRLVQNDTMFSPYIFGAGEGPIREAKRDYLKAEPFRSLSENTTRFLKLKSNDLLGCDRSDSTLATQALQWLSHWVLPPKGEFTPESLAALDPYGLKLYVVSSYLGRCHFDQSRAILELVYQQLQSRYREEPDSEIPVLHYPNVLAYYFNVDLDRKFNQLYLFSLRHGLLWGYFSLGKMLPTEFELSDDILQRDLRPRGLSFEGFMGESEHLNDVLRFDSELLGRLRCGQTACTSRELGEKLVTLIKRFHQSSGEKTATVVFEGQTLQIENSNHGSEIQVSPFKDGLQGIGDYTITKLGPDGRIEEKLYVAGLVPYLIMTRGFFEGIWTEYRVDPVNVVNLFEPKAEVRGQNLISAKQYLSESLQAHEVSLLAKREYYSLR